MPLFSRESALGLHPLSRMQQTRAHVYHLFENTFFKTFLPGLLIKKKYAAFLRLRQGDRSALQLISKLEEIQQRSLPCDYEHIKRLCSQLDDQVHNLVESLTTYNPIRYALLHNYHRKYAFYMRLALLEDEPSVDPPYTLSLDTPQSEELVGGKAATLSRLHGSKDLPVPEGFSITTRAFHLFLKKNRLREMIAERLAELGPDNLEAVHQISPEIQDRIYEGELPKELIASVEASLESHGFKGSSLALRSSAVGEDLQASFAGQFTSLIDIPSQNWPEAFRQILASKYSPHALLYRIGQGMSEGMTPMAVMVMPFVRSRVSGILYTRGQEAPWSASLFMVSGTGEDLAGGSGFEASATFDRSSGALSVSGKASLLDETLIREIFDLGDSLDRLFGQGQDVEWVVDDGDTIHIVQSRPLRFSSKASQSQAQHDREAELFTGQWVSSGQASGPVFRLAPSQSPAAVPHGAVLVTEELPPALTLALPKVTAIVAERGSPACHLASVAREAGIPVLCNAPQARDLQPGQYISLDSDQGQVLDGIHFPSQDSAPDPFRRRSTLLSQRLESALSSVSPLHLRDPDSDDFSIKACRSLHDIVRFVHESGVREMFSLVGRRGLDALGAKRFLTGLPLVMHVLDVHKGLSSEARSAKSVSTEHLRSKPMRHLLAGLGSPAVEWDPAILHYDWDAYSKSSASFVNVEKSTMFSSYAILAEEYLHALLRFGYHFVVVDTVLCPEAEQNYIHFSFKGGGGDTEQRTYRVQLITHILEHFQYAIHRASDLVEASFDRCSQEDTAQNLHVLGIVLGKTVLLDMRLQDEAQVHALASTIIKRIHDLLTVQDRA